MWQILIATSLFSILAAASAGTGQAEKDGQAETWGENTEVVRYERFYIAGQPDAPAIEDAGMEGVTLIINLRSESESDWYEAGAAETFGLQYLQVPVDGRATPLAPEPFNQINQVVEANPDSKILVHCASGNRAAAWLAIYLAQVRGMNAEEAISLARQAGLTSGGLENKVREYLEP